MYQHILVPVDGSLTSALGLDEADLIVLGSHGRRGMGRLLLGSDAEQIARNAVVPVLIVRAIQSTGAAVADSETGTTRAAKVAA